MAELSHFGYLHGHTFAHRLDVRCKLACLFMLTSAILAASSVSVGPLSIGMLLLWRSLKLPALFLGRELLAFSLFLLLVFGARALSASGDPLVSWGSLHISREGLVDGGLVVWRLLMILILGLVFVATTRPANLKAAVQWLLTPVPFVPERKAAVMVGLLVRFIPVMHQQLRETQMALAARSGRRRPLRLSRLRYLILPTMRRVVLSADQLALAMTARCYTEYRTDPDFEAGRWDGVAIGLSAVVLAIALFV
jgi:energy-coupling factor transporter transmembrane protein EcfT